MKRLLLIVPTLVALAATVAVLQAGDAPAAAGDPSDSITVQGNATVSSTPDRATISFGVETQAVTARAALSANASELRRVIAAVKAGGGTDVQTQAVQLSPRYGENGQAVTGYVATNTVSAVVKELAKAGALIDAAVEAGANQIYGPSLARSDQTALYKVALKAAVADAKASAQALAGASGVTLGRVTAVVENGGSQPVPVELQKTMADSTPIEPGTHETPASVTVTFAIS
jgi:uncharacterized protein YggE